MERLDHVLDAVVDSGECGEIPTTVVDLSNGQAVIVRRGAGIPRVSSSGERLGGYFREWISMPGTRWSPD